MYKVPNTITEIVKGTKAKYLYCQGGCLFYEVEVDGRRYEFPIDVTDKDEVGDAVFNRTHKAITLMRYIRKAIANQTLRW
jgi:hypothetical protein